MNLRKRAGRFRHLAVLPDRPLRGLLRSGGGRRFLRGRYLIALIGIMACLAATNPGCGSGVNAGACGTPTHAIKSFAKGVMDYLGAPHSHDNIVSFACWAAAENTDASWNPLATTYDMGGTPCHNTTSDGTTCVRNYGSKSEGEEATARTIQEYSDLNTAFRDGNGVCGGWYSGSFSTWSGGGYSSVCGIIFLPLWWLRRRRR